MERNGYPEETYYTFSYSPIPDDDGTPGGIICANTDDTERVIGERQLALLRELAARTADARSWDEACAPAPRGARDQSARHHLRAALLPCSRAATRRCSPAIAGCRTAIPPLVEALPLGDGSQPWPRLADRRSVGRPAAAPRRPRAGVRRNRAGPAPGTGRPRRRPWSAVPADARDAGGRASWSSGSTPFGCSTTTTPSFLELAAGQIAAAIANADAYRGGAPPGRGAGRARPRQDRLLLQRQPRVPHAADPDAGPARGGADTATAPLEEARQHAALAHRNGNAPAAAGQQPARLLAHRGRPRAGAYEPTDLAQFTADIASSFRSAIEKAGPAAGAATARRCRSRSTSIARCGRRSS